MAAAASDANAATFEVGDVTYVVKKKEIPAISQAGQQANCPDGTAASGGGAKVDDFSLDSEVASSAPFDDNDQGKAPDDGWIAEGNAGITNVQLTAYAVCFDSKHLKYSEDGFKGNSGERGIGTADCNGGARVIGGGVVTSSGSTEVVLSESLPLFGGVEGWAGSFNNGSTATRKATVYAICLTKHTNKITNSNVGSTAAPGRQTAIEDCYHPVGERPLLLAGGASILGGLNGEIASLFPYDDISDLNQAPDDGWRAEFNNEGVMATPTGYQNFCWRG